MVLSESNSRANGILTLEFWIILTAFLGIVSNINSGSGDGFVIAHTPLERNGKSHANDACLETLASTQRRQT